jgi:hypothetical protein
MSTADEVRSILREAGVPLTSRQITDMLPPGIASAAAMFLHDAKKRGELETVMEDGKAAYRFAKGAATVPRSKPAKPKPCAEKPAARTADVTPAAHIDGPGATIIGDAGERDRSSLAELVGYTEAALQAYIESVVDKNIYGFLLNARDAARREYERVHA